MEFFCYIIYINKKWRATHVLEEYANKLFHPERSVLEFLTNTKLKKLCSNWESAFNKLSGERFKLQNYMTL